MATKCKVDPGRLVVRNGVVLTAGQKTEPAPADRVAELAARHAAGLRLFEPGTVPPVQSDRNKGVGRG